MLPLFISSFYILGMRHQRATIIPVLELKACNGATSDEIKVMDRVVQCILKRGEREPFNVVKYPTGLDEMLDDLETTLLLQQQQSGKTQFVLIVDLGGVGKTTFVKEFIIHKLSDYCGFCIFFAFEGLDLVGSTIRSH